MEKNILSISLFNPLRLRMWIFFMLSRQNFTSNFLDQLSPNYVSDNFALIAALTAKDKFPLNMIVSPVQCWAGWD